ncbi:MAG: hypothetical protein KF852_02535 [Saprospiraceae bacterium]|nr:hypothetical protein [Saprospiraceae bacterium]
MNKLKFCLLCLVLAATACQQNKAPRQLKDCPMGVPKPVFPAQMPGVSSHRFTPEPYSATEELILADTLPLTLIQSGCEAPVQEFRFTILRRPERDDSAFWVNKCVEILYAISGMGNELLPLAAWAQTVEDSSPNFILGESLLIQQGAYVTIDRIPSAEGVILLLTLSAEP